MYLITFPYIFTLFQPPWHGLKWFVDSHIFYCKSHTSNHIPWQTVKENEKLPWNTIHHCYLIHFPHIHVTQTHPSRPRQARSGDLDVLRRICGEGGETQIQRDTTLLRSQPGIHCMKHGIQWGNVVSPGYGCCFVTTTKYGYIYHKPNLLEL